MSLDKPLRRLTLRELTAHAEKRSRMVIEHLHSTLLTQISDFRDLSRPVRRRTHYPTLIALQHALESLQTVTKEVQDLADELHEQLQEIDERARKEKVNRV